MDEINTFLKEYHNELQSPAADEIIHPKIVGKYILDRSDVSNQIIDWVLHYLDSKKCPYQLAVAIAKNTAQQIEANILEQSQEYVNSDKDELLNTLTLYTETIKKLPVICQSFMDDLNGKETFSSSCSLPYTASVFAIRNKRRRMEDRHVIHHDLNLLLDLKNAPAHSYYAVFDGHSGVDAASYAAAHLHVNIAKHPSFLTDTVTAITEAYKITDENFLKKCSEWNLKSGSTAICALIRERTLYLSWVGDSQAVLVKEGKPVIVTNPHKPDREEERKRIEDLGGEVNCHTGIARVNGVLAVTRALGDIDHKRFICSEPEITTVTLDGTEDFLILACDGLWDGMSPEDVTSALYHNLSGSALDEPLDAVAAKLVHQSKLQGSEDNITAVVVFLRDSKTIKEYATELVTRVSPQLNFFEMNGGEKGCPSEEISNSLCTKPTVLEFNAASAKKLKNTANVLSSAGITDPSYACPYSESSIEGVAFQKVTSEAIFVPQAKIPSCLAPEATALSELPTPPIDDVLASQDFEKLSSDLSQDFSSLSLEPKPASDSAAVNISSSFGLTETNDILTLEDTKYAITPEEAVDIASSVVSNTIETAVKQISSSASPEAISPVSTHKLNPYAEPFVMKSFISNENQDQTDQTTAGPESAPSEMLSVNEKNESSVIKSVDDLPNTIPNLIDTDNVASEDFSCADKSINKPDESNTSLISLGNECKQDLLTHTSSSTNEPEPQFIEKTTEYVNMSPNPNMHSDVNNIVEPWSELDTNIASAPPLEDLPASKDEKLELSFTSAINTTDAINVVDESFSINPHENPSDSIKEDLFKNVTPGCPISDDGPFISNESPFELNEDLKKNSPEGPKSENPTLPNQLSDGALFTHDLPASSNNIDKTNSSVLLDQSKELFNLSGMTLSPQKAPEVENLLENEPLNKSNKIEDTAEKSSPVKEDASASIGALVSVENTSGISNDALPDQVSNAAKILNDILASPKNTTEIGNSLICDANTELATTAVVLSVNSVDECPVETTVDLQALPEGIPEAEGVTEDVDSDSEKDGGWSYMKGNTVVGGKPKPKETLTKTGKQSSMSDATLKTKKEPLKPSLDSKSKLKAAPLDKTKKPLPEKKVMDPKDPKNKVRNVPSTLPKAPVEKSTKPTTMVRVKKELPVSSVNKVTSVASTKSTTVRNTMSTSKSATLTGTGQSQLSTPKPVSSSPTIGTARPKSAASGIGTKTTARPTGTTVPASKGSSTVQSNKSNVASTARSTTLSRPASSTVPNKTITKSSTLAKPPVSESKTKPVSTMIRKTAAPLAKKPDPKETNVKETKDTVNKQISERKNVLNKKDTLKSATIPAKNVTSVSNKPAAAKPRPAPIKNDINKKDVPKVNKTIAKLPPKTNTLSKASQNAATGKEKKNLPLEDKSNEKRNDPVVENEQSVPESTPVCEEEKFILEANDKEVIVKEQDEAPVNSDSKIVVENNTKMEGNSSEEMPAASVAS
ncbi:mucin-17-like isoform X1 [Argiope bruennichi]|uniref:mucin-17-like isoform X1 n=2 Tax=Argiope bruennichi TaxID=94029 RepID=UPI0024958E82|nr:mucin-17-like isoform X1 [Argiope bruennichi]